MYTSYLNSKSFNMNFKRYLKEATSMLRDKYSRATILLTGNFNRRLGLERDQQSCYSCFMFRKTEMLKVIILPVSNSARTRCNAERKKSTDFCEASTGNFLLKFRDNPSVPSSRFKNFWK
jgi:C1A family cysteine protease